MNNKQDDQLIDELAALIHDIWAEWWKYQKQWNDAKIEYPDHLMLSPDKVKQWDRQADTSYFDLSDQEQKSDLKIAARYMKLFGKMLSEKYEAGYWHGILEKGGNTAERIDEQVEHLEKVEYKKQLEEVTRQVTDCANRAFQKLAEEKNKKNDK